MLGLGQLYHDSQLHLVTSFTRPWAHYVSWSCGMRLLSFVVVLVQDVAAPAVGTPTWHVSALLVLWLLLTSSHACWWPGVFRCPSSNRVMQLLNLSFTATLFLGNMADSQVRSIFTVASVLTVFLAAIQGIAGAGIACLGAWTYWGRQRALHMWPVTEEKIFLWAVNEKPLINTLREAHGLLAAAALTPPEFQPLAAFTACAFRLDAFRRTTQADQHVLEWTVQDLCEDLSRIMDQCKGTLLPNALVESALVGFSGALRRKARHLATMHPCKRRILLKLLAARALLTDAYVYGDRGVWAGGAPAPVEIGATASAAIAQSRGPSTMATVKPARTPKRATREELAASLDLTLPADQQGYVPLITRQHTAMIMGADAAAAALDELPRTVDDLAAYLPPAARTPGGAAEAPLFFEDEEDDEDNPLMHR